jgi:hypothetical protein
MLSMKSITFWDVTLCSPVKGCFGGTHHLHIQCQKKSQSRNQHEAGSQNMGGILSVNMVTRHIPENSSLHRLNLAVMPG